MQHIIGDIGGTNARFAIVEDGQILYQSSLKCSDYEGLQQAVEAYIATLPTSVDVKRAAFALAGPITGEDHFRLTNHPWQFSISETKQILGVEQLHMLNDFHAVALSVPYLKHKDLTQIGGGVARERSNIAVIGPGTGLGVASLIYNDPMSNYVALPCEGGHVTVPARTQREFDVFQWLLSHKYSHVSAERVCSGKGMANLYRAIRALDCRDDLPPRMEPKEISRRAFEENCELSLEIITMMMGILGRVAGNLALTTNALGGVYLVGGILPKLGIDFIQSSNFRENFRSKGRYKEFMDAIPTYLVDDHFLALKGLRAEVENA